MLLQHLLLLRDELLLGERHTHTWLHLVLLLLEHCGVGGRAEDVRAWVLLLGGARRRRCAQSLQERVARIDRRARVKERPTVFILLLHDQIRGIELAAL